MHDADLVTSKCNEIVCLYLFEYLRQTKFQRMLSFSETLSYKLHFIIHLNATVRELKRIAIFY